MALLTTGKGFVRAVEKSGAVAIYAPLEGGYEGRYVRRLRCSGYKVVNLTARGLGDVAAYLTDYHGVRPAHLGKKDIAGSGAMVGLRAYVPGIATYQLENIPAKSKGIILWIIEGYVLSRQEQEYLVTLTRENPQIKVVIEMGGDRIFSFKPLAETLA
ncbi:NAD(P)H-quinone oxidoreductase subunit N [[Leptolyngbya] sp. PCC 7376]|uniref:NAD(P)H-quinone oxidoreductase subunit N n=1 Tax=[Leptolyngbya] sp. PCC 7376 TaxID=111781 RepID=UPI00029F3170|nr:NAD(P)H-quinone oxidoreductase subunit N [[Leptolyngbya] sp. PCC 7376]AFY38433.1 NAD(P)H-quinone oxidoreductase subunit N [[Leptolyngbya] sp. PCC 7376]